MTHAAHAAHKGYVEMEEKAWYCLKCGCQLGVVISGRPSRLQYQSAVIYQADITCPRCGEVRRFQLDKGYVADLVRKLKAA